MRKNVLRTSIAAIGVAVLVGGCAHYHHRRAPDAAFPQVVLAANGSLVVNQEPVVILRKPGQTAVVTWQVSEQSGVRFNAGNGIEFTALLKVPSKVKGQPPIKLEQPRSVDSNLFGCTTQKDGLEVVCKISPEVPPGLYSYTVNATREGKPLVLDPTGWIEETQGP